MAAQRIVLTLTNVILAWQAVSWRPGPWPGHQKLRRFLPFSLHVLVLRGAELASVQMPTILIGAMLGSMRLGYFTMAWRIVELASFLIITPVRTAALPAFAARRGQLKGRIDPLFLDTLRLVGFLAIPAFVGLAAVAQETVLLFGGPNWWQAAPALATAVAMLVEEPMLEAAIMAATERFDFEEQQRLVKRKLEFDSRLRQMAGADADRTV